MLNIILCGGALSNKYEDKIFNALLAAGYSPEREYKAVPKRKFRFDLALVDEKILIEFNGGIYRNGRHTRSYGYASDMVKYRLATILGYSVLAYTTKDAKGKNWEFGVVADVVELLKNRRSEK